MAHRINLSKSDRRGLVGVVLLLACICAGRWIYVEHAAQHQPAGLQAEDVAEVERFEQEVAEMQAAQAARHRDKRQVEPALFAFDPNTADSATLYRLGLREWQIRNMMRYRRKGGRWKSAEDFGRLYGLSHEEHERLRPYVRIVPGNAEKIRREEAKRRDSVRAKHYIEKYPAGTVIDLNTADTTALKRIPGIGSYYAAKICRYRERLGGFVSPGQIKEVEGLPADAEKWFEVGDSAEIRQLDLNKATFSQLVRHPYLNYEQVKAICNYRQKYGKVRYWRELSLTELFSEADTVRLKAYVIF